MASNLRITAVLLSFSINIIGALLYIIGCILIGSLLLQYRHSPVHGSQQSQWTKIAQLQFNLGI
jgi:hypothetical protein